MESALVYQLQISEIKMADIVDVDLSRLGTTKFGNFIVEVVDPVSDYLELMEVWTKVGFIHKEILLVDSTLSFLRCFLQNVFDFQLIKALLSRPDFRYDYVYTSSVKFSNYSSCFIEFVRLLKPFDYVMFR